MPIKLARVVFILCNMRRGRKMHAVGNVLIINTLLFDVVLWHHVVFPQTSSAATEAERRCRSLLASVQVPVNLDVARIGGHE
jgi:hypothetical protein